MVEPYEPHRVRKAIEVPFVYIVIQDMKYQFDKIILDDDEHKAIAKKKNSFS